MPRDPAEAFHTLSRLVRGMNETVQSLWDTVHVLRLELDTVRPAASMPDHSDHRPPIWHGPPRNADPAERLDTLQLQFDALNGDAEYLWFEAQWLRAQIAVALTSVTPPGRV